MCPWNGSGSFSRSDGTFSGTQVWQNNRDADIKIRADSHDTHDEDLADGIENCLTKDGQNAATADLPMGGFKHTNVDDAAARNQYASAGQVQDGTLNWVDGGGTADAITATYSPALTALVDGQICCVRATAANATTTPTFSPNSLTARTIVKHGGSALAAGDIAGDGHEIILRYDLSNTRWELLNPKVPSIATVADTGTANTFTKDQTIQSADAGALVGPKLTLDRNSASPADDDVLGAVVFNGRDDGGNATAYAQIQAEAADVTDTEEDGRLALQTNVAGTVATRVTVGQGVVVGSATGGDKGAGTVNATGVYIDGTALRVPGWLFSSGATAIGTDTTKDITAINGDGTVNEIVIWLEGVTQDAANQSLMLQIGDSGGIENTGYTGGVALAGGTRVANSAGFNLTDNSNYDAAVPFHGKVILTHMGGNIWSSSHVANDGASAGRDWHGAGLKTLSAELSQLRITTAGGSASFTAGTIYVVAR